MKSKRDKILNNRSINFLILLSTFFIIEISILGADHIKGIIIVSGIMIILIFIIFLIGMFTKR